MVLATGSALVLGHFDAAAAVGAMAALGEPEMNGIGGNGFMAVFHKASGKVWSLSMAGAALPPSRRRYGGQVAPRRVEGKGTSLRAPRRPKGEPTGTKWPALYI